MERGSKRSADQEKEAKDRESMHHLLMHLLAAKLLIPFVRFDTTGTCCCYTSCMNFSLSLSSFDLQFDAGIKSHHHDHDFSLLSQNQEVSPLFLWNESLESDAVNQREECRFCHCRRSRLSTLFPTHCMPVHISDERANEIREWECCDRSGMCFLLPHRSSLSSHPASLM